MSNEGKILQIYWTSYVNFYLPVSKGDSRLYCKDIFNLPTISVFILKKNLLHNFIKSSKNGQSESLTCKNLFMFELY